MKKLTLVAAAISLLFSSYALAKDHRDEEAEVHGTISVAKNTSESSLPNLSSLTMFRALEVALDRIPGKPLSIELENDDGYLVYEAKIVRPDGSIKEVTIDAGNGKVLEIEDKE